MYRDLREFIDDVERAGELKRIDGADPNLEIGAITEVAAGSDSCPMILFDRIKGYPQGFRIVTNLLHTPKRYALAVGLQPDLKGIAGVRAWKERIKRIGYVAPVEVKEGPVKENIFFDKDINVLSFPVPKWHELDPGRYFGTGAVTITRDPDDGWIDCGVFRLQVHDASTLGIYISTGRHLKIIAEKYWSRGKNCPVAVCTGTDPSLFIAAAFPDVPFGVSEYGFAGWIRGKGVEVIHGELTGLPIPAASEIALEGEMPPPEVESRLEGPFGEAVGYYASGSMKRPVIRIKCLMHRDEPILHGAPPMRPLRGMFHFGPHHRADAIWGELEKANINGVKGVWQYGLGMTVISMKQLNPGEAKRALMVAAGSRQGDLQRFFVVVDEDVDPSNIEEVLWAMSSRCEPSESIDIVRDRTIDGIDPRISPEDRELGYLTMSQALIDACRPYRWKDKFPKVNAVSAELRAKTIEKWGNKLF